MVSEPCVLYFRRWHLRTAEGSRGCAVLRRAVEFGVNFIDSAYSYDPYLSEELIARALARYPKDIGIATKGADGIVRDRTSGPTIHPQAPAQSRRTQRT